MCSFEHTYDPIVQRSDSGFSLLEVIVALGILAVGVGAAISLFTAGTAAHSRAIDRLKAIEISESVFAAIEGALRDGANIEDIQTSDLIPSVLESWPGVKVEIAFSTIPKPDFVDEVVIRLGIRWISRGQQAEEKFEQIIARSRSVRLLPE
ncbi:MAG: prepilin-type N-terminal cleavage/methylation domain-containing protein [Planctomycetota bacterium]|nr:prepilin-type N-terminal cleavage/methylation domain-containing protein [Planctomycetota bacterium]MDG2085570.1 prepilin-type N-terminal cleavage/methylation domain-containing protein [Planctomycetota bacterium]